MADKLTPGDRSANMAAIRSKDTLPELVVRSVAHRLGYRFRLHGAGLPGKPDLVFKRFRKVVFVHGCFWHQHTECREGRPPKSNAGYWGPKLRRNIERDSLHLKSLTDLGWDSLVIWECEVHDRRALAARIKAFLSRNAGRHGREANEATRVDAPFL